MAALMPPDPAAARAAAPIRPGHDNYLGCLRLVLSLGVLYSHSYPLTGDAIHEPPFGTVAVDTFFLISGFLITQSWLDSRSPQEFVVKRIARIYPGYWVAFVFSALVGVFYSRPESRVYLRHIVPVHQEVLKSLLFLSHGSLDAETVFAGNPLPHEVNGSLWTLQPELTCYLLVLVCGSFPLLRHRRGMLAALGVVLLGMTANVWCEHDVIHSFWRFLSCFLAGMVFYLYRERLPARPWVIAFALAGLVSCFTCSPTYPVLYPVCGGGVLFSFAFRRPPEFLRWNTDLSYGVYVYSFPVQQACVASLHLRPPAIWLTLLATPLVLGLAALSWHYVERPAIEFARRRYILAQRAPA